MILSVVLNAVLLLAPPEAVEPTVSQAQIEQAIHDLGDDRFTVREAASKLLWQAGSAAEPALREALESKDLEVVSRARALLGKLDYGIRPDTPAEVVELIDQYRYGQRDEKLAAIEELRRRGEIVLMFRLVNSEPDEELHKEISRRMLADIDRIVPRLLADEKYADAEQLLEQSSRMDQGPNNYAVYLLLRGKADAKLAELRNPKRASNPAESRLRLLATLLRLKGELPEAWEAAAKTDDNELKRGILYEQHRWNDLAQLYDRLEQRKDIQNMGYLAYYHRRAGDEEAFNQDLENLHTRAETVPDQLGLCVEALMLLDQPNEAIELLQEAQPRTAFDLRRHQERYTEAFELLGINAKNPPTPEWLREYKFDLPENPSREAARGHLGLQVAELLHRLGKLEESRALLVVAARQFPPDNLQAQGRIWRTTFKIGPEDEALRLGAELITRFEGEKKDMFSQLLPAHSAQARLWWGYFRSHTADESVDHTWRRVLQLFRPPPNGLSNDEWERLVAEVSSLPMLDPGERNSWMTSIGEIFLIRGERVKAREFLIKAAELRLTHHLCLQIADLFAQDKQWDEAAKWYHRAYQSDPASALALYLQGHALLQLNSQSVEGRHKTELATLLPLANVSQRDTLAEGLRERGLREEAIRQWELALRVSAPEDTAAGGAAQNLGNALSGHDDLRAADYWEQSTLRIFQTNISITQVEGNLELPFLIHKIRGRGFLKAGKVKEALEEAKLAQAGMPADVDLAIDLVPKLDRADHQGEADRLFEEIYAVNASNCHEYPEFASGHNNTAWLAAKCRRRLDEALAHANRAVELEPDNPAFLDTLAEVYFQRGDRAKAVELSKRTIEMAPTREIYREQLARFEKEAP